MNIVDQFLDIDPGQKGAAIAMGNFDGVHKGHLQVLRSAANVAKEAKAALGAAVFHPHPKKFFLPSALPSRLQSNEARAKSLQDFGVHTLYAIPFDRELSLMSDRQFAKQVLKDGLGICHVSVGENYRFGKDRMGDVQSLHAYGKEFGFSVDAVGLQGDEAAVFSSTRVREALAKGDCEMAATVLDRLWSIEGLVEFGEQRGRTIGVPTANISLGEYLRPRFGVYAAFAQIEGEGPFLPGVVNIGTRPTMDGTEERLEIHLFDFAGDLYGRSLQVSLLHFIRDEQKFDGLDALRQQITIDMVEAKTRTGAFLKVDQSVSS